MMVFRPFLYATFLMLLLVIPLNTTAQEATPDTTTVTTSKKQRPISDPGRAAILSATLPGMGQIYNRKYWKVPIIYAGFGAIVYYLDAHSTEYAKYRAAYISRIDGNPNTVDDFPLYSTDVLQRAMNFYRRNLEVTYLLGAALYMLNILDANIDAHLMDFDVGENLSFNLRPLWTPFVTHGSDIVPNAGLSVRISFKN